MMQIQLPINDEDRLVAKLTAISISLALIDMALPFPLPGIKPGLANIITLLVFLYFGLRLTVWVVLVRIFVVNILTGQILLPAMFLSLFGNFASLFVLFLIYYFDKIVKRSKLNFLSSSFSVLSLSVLCSFAHITGQLILARLWLIPHNGIFAIVPIYFASALFFGILNGLAIMFLLNYIDNEQVN